MRPLPTTPCRRTEAFTLIELLTVIAIIGILAAILIPTVAKVRNAASKATVVSNFRQIGNAVLMFASDNKDRLPGPQTDNAGWSFLSGQQLLAPVEVAVARTYLHAPFATSIGTYLGVTKATALGSERYVCRQYLSPAFLAASAESPWPNDKIFIMGLTVNTVITPFGTSQRRAMTLGALNAQVPISRRYMLREGIGNSITAPLHGDGYVAVYFDGHVGFIRKNDSAGINNSLL